MALSVARGRPIHSGGRAYRRTIALVRSVEPSLKGRSTILETTSREVRGKSTSTSTLSRVTTCRDRDDE